MAKLGAPVQVPDFYAQQGDWRAAFAAESAWYTEFSRDKDIVSFSVADGKALYLVEDDGATLRHIALGDAYTAHPALIRGLRKDEVQAMVRAERHWKELAAKRKAEKAARA